MEFATWSPRMLSVLRIMAALLFIQHWTQKFFGFPPPASPGPGLTTLLVVQGFLELVGGFLLLIGFHPACCLHPRRRHGSRLFHETRPEELLSSAQRG
jgi:uncharacterized membrane protein YphA (DoxX/SURF4 family)